MSTQNKGEIQVYIADPQREKVERFSGWIFMSFGNCVFLYN
jgi:hypothetical protein